jgi:excisionase family DNA binding protein
MTQPLPKQVATRYMTITEACRALSVSRWTVKRWRDSGLLQWRAWAGGRVLISRDSVRQMLDT